MWNGCARDGEIIDGFDGTTRKKTTTPITHHESLALLNWRSLLNLKLVMMENSATSTTLTERLN